MIRSRTGLGILAAVTLLWPAFWAWTYYDASSWAIRFGAAYSDTYQQMREARGTQRDTPESRAYFDGKLLQADDLRREQIARRGSALRFGIGGLLILLGSILLRTWTWRRLRVRALPVTASTKRSC